MSMWSKLRDFLVGGATGATAAVGDVKVNPEFASLVMYGDAPVAHSMSRNYTSFAKEGFRDPTVYKVISYISRNGAAIPPVLYTDRTRRRRIDTHPLLDLLNAPNPDMSGVMYREAVMGYLLLAGNSYQYAIRGRSAPPDELWPLRPDYVEIIPSRTRGIVGYQYKPADIPYSPQDVNHVKYWCPDDALYGLSPVEVAAILIDQQTAARKWNLALLQNWARLPGAWVVPTPIGKNERDRLEQKLKEKMQGYKNAGAPPVLDAGLSWQAMGVPPAQMDWIEGISLNASQIANIYGLAPMVIGDTSATTYDNFKQAEIYSYTEAVFPDLDKIYDGWNTWLVPMFPDLRASGAYLYYDKETVEVIQEMIQGQKDAQSARATSMFEATECTLNEARVLQGLPRLKGGDRLKMGAALIPVEMLAQPVVITAGASGLIENAEDGSDAQPIDTGGRGSDTSPTAAGPKKQAGAAGSPEEEDAGADDGDAAAAAALLASLQEAGASKSRRSSTQTEADLARAILHLRRLVVEQQKYNECHDAGGRFCSTGGGEGGGGGGGGGANQWHPPLSEDNRIAVQDAGWTWEGALSPGEHSAVEAYGSTRQGFLLNRQLRSGQVSPENQQMAAALDSALAKGSAPVDLVAYRGFGPNSWARLQSAQGHTFTDAAYPSLSLDENIGRSYAYGIGGTEEGVLAQVSIPAGSPGAYISPALPFDGPQEAQFLLPRVSTFRVTSTFLDAQGRRCATLEYLPPSLTSKARHARLHEEEAASSPTSPTPGRAALYLWQAGDIEWQTSLDGGQHHVREDGTHATSDDTGYPTYAPPPSGPGKRIPKASVLVRKVGGHGGSASTYTDGAGVQLYTFPIPDDTSDEGDDQASEEDIPPPRGQSWREERDILIVAALLDMQDRQVTHVRWVVDGNPCERCLLNDGEVREVGEEFPSGDLFPPVHPNCFPAGTLVSGPPVVGSTTRWYSGPLVELRTAGGKFLAMTPNHPVLTPHGWIAAGLLKEGDQVVSRRTGERGLPPVHPDDYQMPAMIEQVATTCGGAREVTTRAVPGAAVDFHGDGIEGQISIVRTNGLLQHDLDSLLREPQRQDLLGRRDADLPLLTRLRGLAAFLSRAGHSAHGLLRGLRAAPAFFWREACLHETAGFRRSPALHLACAQASGYGLTGDAELPGKSLLRLSGQVSPADVLVRQRERSPARGRRPLPPLASHRFLGTPLPAFQEHTSQSLGAEMVPDRGLLTAYAGEIVVDRIVECAQVSFAGHVYNLQTTQGWYIANDIITHNCMCTFVEYSQPQFGFASRQHHQSSTRQAHLDLDEKARQTDDGVTTPHTGIMLALVPPPGVARALVLSDADTEGALAAEALHLTLCYLGDTTDEGAPEWAALARVARAAARAQQEPLTGRIGGLGRFTPAHEGDPVPFVALADVGGLSAFRTALVEALTEAGIAVAHDHDFTPHLTLAYLPAEGEDEASASEPGDVALPDLAVRFDALWLAFGEQRAAFPFGAATASGNVGAETMTAPTPVAAVPRERGRSPFQSFMEAMTQ